MPASCAGPGRSGVSMGIAPGSTAGSGNMFAAGHSPVGPSSGAVFVFN